jgi:hypothetical protein
MRTAKELDVCSGRLPGDVEDDMLGRIDRQKRGTTTKANVDTAALELIGVGLPGVVEGGMSGRNMQRKLGSARGSPRRSRTAKAPHINRWGGEAAVCLRVGRMGPIK